MPIREFVESKGVHKAGPKWSMNGTAAATEHQAPSSRVHYDSNPEISLQSTAAAVRRNYEDVYAVTGMSSCCFVESGLQCYGGMAKLGCRRFIRFKSDVSELMYDIT